MNKPDISSMDYKYGIFSKIGRKGWTNEQRKNLVERIKNAGYK